MTHSDITDTVEIGDRILVVSPLNDASRESLDHWVRERFAERSAILIDAQKSDAAKTILAEACAKTIMTLTFASKEGAQFIGTIDGMAFLIWQMVKDNEPDVTVDWLRKQMLDPSNVRKANDKFEQMQGIKNAKRRSSSSGKRR